MSEVKNQRPKKSRKDIIKDITIAFLAILLLLTFFSNTIMNYSLPEVAIQQIQEGTISPVIRGKGTIEAKDPYKVKTTQERVIKSVAVEVGAKVKKGDVIYNLEDKESTELEEARQKLDELTQSYEASLFSGDLDNDAINRVRGGVTLSMDQIQAKLKEATDRYDAAKLADEEAQAVIEEQSQNQAYTSAQYSYDEATPDYRDADITVRLTEIDQLLESSKSDIDLTSAESEVSSAESAKDDAKKKYGKDSDEYETAKEKLKKAKDKLARLKTQKEMADQIVQSLEDEKNQLQLEQANLSKDKSQITTQQGQVDSDYTRKAASLQDTKNKTALELERATQDRTDLLTEISKEIELDGQRDDIAEQRKTVEKLEKESVGATITAPVDGTISELYLKAGETTSAENEVALIQVDGKGMQASFAVTIDEAKRLKVGDIAEPTNAWYYTDFKAVLKSIDTDKENPNTKKILTFTVESPEVQNGQQVQLQIGDKSDNYDLTIPAGCVREDSNGKFILVVNSKSSPLGNRYIAARVDVEVLAQDDTTAAISGSLEGDEYVITTSTSPIKSGDQVRLANDQ